MVDYNKEAGTLLRRLRRARRMTLEAASLRLNTSAPMLSRKERGTAKIDRVDIRLAISAYNLAPSEAAILWATAGMAPDFNAPPEAGHSLRGIAIETLSDLRFPAFIRDIYWRICAWNRGIEILWAPATNGVPFHLIDNLFRHHRRTQLGERWRRHLSIALYQWYLSTRSIADDPYFRALIDELAERWGAEFTDRWDEVRLNARVPGGNDDGEEQMLGNVLRFDTRQGPVQYIRTRGVDEFPNRHRLLVLLPLNSEDQERNDQLFDAWEGERIYFSDGACMRE